MIKQLMALVPVTTSATVAVAVATHVAGGGFTAPAPPQAGGAAVHVRLGLRGGGACIPLLQGQGGSSNAEVDSDAETGNLETELNVKDDVSSACPSQCGMKKNTNPKNIRYMSDSAGAVVPDPRSTNFCCMKCSCTPSKHNSVCAQLAVDAGGGDTNVYQV